MSSLASLIDLFSRQAATGQAATQENFARAPMIQAAAMQQLAQGLQRERMQLTDALIQAKQEKAQAAQQGMQLGMQLAQRQIGANIEMAFRARQAEMERAAEAEQAGLERTSREKIAGMREGEGGKSISPDQQEKADTLTYLEEVGQYPTSQPSERSLTAQRVMNRAAGMGIEPQTYARGMRVGLSPSELKPELTSAGAAAKDAMDVLIESWDRQVFAGNLPDTNAANDAFQATLTTAKQNGATKEEMDDLVQIYFQWRARATGAAPSATPSTGAPAATSQPAGAPMVNQPATAPGRPDILGLPNWMSRGIGALPGLFKRAQPGPERYVGPEAEPIQPGEYAPLENAMMLGMPTSQPSIATQPSLTPQEIRWMTRRRYGGME